MAPLSRGFTLTIIGAGAVGSAFALALSRKGFRILEICSLTKRSAQRLARMVSPACTVSSTGLLTCVPRLILLCVPDQAVASSVEKLTADRSLDLSHTTVLHTSGVLGNEVFLPLKGRVASSGMLHPIQSFPHASKPKDLIERIEGIAFGFEGDSHALSVARSIVRALNGRIIRIPKEGKILYHLSCVFASNYAVALVEAIRRSSMHVGGGFRVEDVERLMRSSVDSAFSMGPAEALTGPIARGSVETIRMHTKQMRRSCPELVPSYQALGDIALELSKRAGRLDGRVLRKVTKALHPSSQKKRSRSTLMRTADTRKRT
jgi:predicted short-subunit dehydrogenase-like oxidoreductase (DUF2520 family)